MKMLRIVHLSMHPMQHAASKSKVSCNNESGEKLSKSFTHNPTVSGYPSCSVPHRLEKLSREIQCKQVCRHVPLFVVVHLKLNSKNVI